MAKKERQNYRERLTEVPQGIQLNKEVEGRFARWLLRSIREAFQSEDNRKEFEQWYLEKNGKPYVWRNIKGEVIVWDK